jgi:hypothetical protein
MLKIGTVLGLLAAMTAGGRQSGRMLRDEAEKERTRKGEYRKVYTFRVGFPSHTFAHLMHRSSYNARRRAAGKRR